MPGEPPGIWRRFSVLELGVIMLSAAAIVQVGVGIYFNWPPLGFPFNQPLDEVMILLGLELVAALAIGLPCLLEIRRRVLQETPEP